MSLPERPINPPEPEPNPQAEREDYEYQTPEIRRAIAEEAIVALDECQQALILLDRSDPADVDNFREIVGQDREFDAFKALERIKEMVEEHIRNKIVPWEDKSHEQ